MKNVMNGKIINSAKAAYLENVVTVVIDFGNAID